MRRRSLVMALQAAAVFCAAIVMSIPVTTAINVRIFMPGESVPGQEFEFDPSLKVERLIEAKPEDPGDTRWENVKVKVSIVGRDLKYEVKKIYLFRCRDSSPSACSVDIPIEANNYLSGERASFNWDSDIENNGVANFMTIVEMGYGGKDIWIGFWDSIRREASDKFVRYSYKLDNLDVYAKAGSDVQWIRNYMENYYMIPSEWTEKAVMGKVEGSDVSMNYALSADRSDLLNLLQHQLSSESKQGGTATPKADDYTFIFGKDVMEFPFTFFSDVPVRCGDGECETILGENSDNCCRDCKCPEEEECTRSNEYPNGMCHVCGDGTPDPVENETNCCADTECPGVLACRTTEDNPHGTCVTPNCGDGNCDTEEESLDNCCRDCGGTDACKSANDETYYCNEDLMKCMQPECGDEKCMSPYEDHNGSLACCKDCDDCPDGKYCNETISDTGTCIPAGCTYRGCEPGEEYGGPNECCTDCDDCPTGEVCEQNICHDCGDGFPEPPVETEANCCEDTGCSDGTGYCSESNACLQPGEMGLNIMLSPSSDLDCGQGENAEPLRVVINIENRPKFFEQYASGGYTYNGGYEPMSCTVSGYAYECEIPLSGTEVFPGCFKGGEDELTINVSLRYRQNESSDIVTAYVSKTVDINVTNPLNKTCNGIDGCQKYLGEDSNNCCHDCGCATPQVCLDNTCRPESDIALEVDESSLPPPNRVVCRQDGMDLEYVDFSASVINVPSTLVGGETFDFVDGSFALHYRGETYDGSDSLECYPEENELGLTGKVDCRIPVVSFPPCPAEPPQTLRFSVNVTGGGLYLLYGSTGKQISDEFSVSYVRGLPRCGTDGCNPEDGENESSCCLDCGCPEGDFCSIEQGCASEDSMVLNLTVEPQQMNCSDPKEKEVVFRAEVSPKPVVQRVIGFDTMNTYLNGTDIGFGYCMPMEVGGMPSPYVLECRVSYADFPTCWEIDGKTAELNTTFSFTNITGDIRSRDLSGRDDYEIIHVMDRPCYDEYHCDINIGEMMDQCCRGCGCSGGRMCSLDNLCVDVDSLEIEVDPVSVEADCGGYNEIKFTAEIVNQPYWPRGDTWATEVNGKVFEGTPTCYLDSEIPGVDNVYTCSIYLIDVPEICASEDEKNLTIVANMTYFDAAVQEEKWIGINGSILVTPTNLQDSCTNPIYSDYGIPGCQKGLGETQENCCQDCGCSDFGEEFVCTMNGCVDKSLITMHIAEDAIVKECLVVPTEVTWGDPDWWPLTPEGIKKGDIAGYECHITGKPLKVELVISDLPVSSSLDSEAVVTFDGVSYDQVVFEEKGKYYVSFRPNAEESETGATGAGAIDTSHIFNVSIIIDVNPTWTDDADEEFQMNFTSNDVSLSYTVKESDTLENVIERLDKYTKNMKKMFTLIKLMLAFVGICNGCVRPDKLAANKDTLNVKETSASLALAQAVKVAIENIEKVLVMGGMITSAFIDNLWISIPGSYLAGIAIGVGLYFITWNNPGWICNNILNFEKLKVKGLCVYVKKYAWAPLIAIGFLVYDSIKNIEGDVNAEMQLAQTEVIENTEYW